MHQLTGDWMLQAEKLKVFILQSLVTVGRKEYGWFIASMQAPSGYLFSCERSSRRAAPLWKQSL